MFRKYLYFCFIFSKIFIKFSFHTKFSQDHYSGFIFLSFTNFFNKFFYYNNFQSLIFRISTFFAGFFLILLMWLILLLLVTNVVDVNVDVSVFSLTLPYIMAITSKSCLCSVADFFSIFLN